MGIRGLTTYISQNSDRFHEPHKLHDCHLVIDGSSLASQLYICVSKCNSSFGGDYDKYGQTVKDFFSVLIKCKITPLVIFDGGYETRKLKTVSYRFKTKILNAVACNPATQSTSSVFPLLMKEVFKQVLEEVNIKFAQADFEADDEIAAIARYLNCPVLSYDSDFYVFDVLYIPFSTLDLEPSKIKKVDGSVIYAVSCQIYRVEKFVQNFGGLDKSLLPLMATVLGNDYVPSRLFSKFFNHVKFSKSKHLSKQQKKIRAVFEWLRKESPASAVKKILNHLRKKDREYVSQQLQRSIAGYMQCTSELLPYLGINVGAMSTSSATVEDIYNFEHVDVTPMSDAESSAESEDDACDDTDEDNFEPLEGIMVDDRGSDLAYPTWLQCKFRKGELSSYVSDMFFLKTYFCQPQVEDFTSTDSHELSFPIIKVLYGLLMTDQHLSQEEPLKCYLRSSKAKAQTISLSPVFCLSDLSPLPRLSLLLETSIGSRRAVLFDTVGFSTGDVGILDTLPDSWKLFVVAVVFWGRNASHVTNCHIHAIILGIVSLGIVDTTIGFVRNRKTLMKKGKIMKVKQSSDCESLGVWPPCVQNAELKSDHVSPKDAVQNVTEEDCTRLSEKLFSFFQVDDKLKGSPRQFNTVVVHLFAQLQTCLLQIMTLNSLLDFPVPTCNIAQTYSGTLAYNAFQNFNRRSSVEAYVSSLMSDAQTVLTVYKTTYSLVSKLLPQMSVLVRKKKKRKKKAVQAEECKINSDLDLSDENDPSIIDVNNKFSLLRQACK